MKVNLELATQLREKIYSDLEAGKVYSCRSKKGARLFLTLISAEERAAHWADDASYVLDSYRWKTYGKKTCYNYIYQRAWWGHSIGIGVMPIDRIPREVEVISFEDLLQSHC